MRFIILLGTLLCLLSVALTTKHSYKRRERSKRSKTNSGRNLNQEETYETTLAKDIIEEQDRSEQDHVDLALGSENFSSDIDHMILMNSNPVMSEYSDNYDIDSDDDSTKQNEASKKNKVDVDENPLESIGFEADTSDNEDDQKSSVKTTDTQTVGLKNDASTKAKDKELKTTKENAPLVGFKTNDISDPDSFITVNDESKITKSETGIASILESKNSADEGLEISNSGANIISDPNSRNSVSEELKISNSDKHAVNEENTRIDLKLTKPAKKMADKISEPTKKHIVGNKNSSTTAATKTQSPFVELYGKGEIQDAMEKAGLGSKRQMHPVDGDAVTVAQGSMQRGIQPGQPFHMDDIRHIRQMQKTIGFSDKIIDHQLPGAPFTVDNDDRDDDDDEEYAGYDNDNVDSYDSPEDDGDDFDDDEPDNSRHFDGGEKIIKGRANAWRKATISPKGSTMIGSDDVTNDTEEDEEDEDEPEDKAAERKSIDIPNDMEEMAEEKGLETLHDDDQLTMDTHAYHVYHPPNHLLGKVYTKYSKENVQQSIAQTNPCENGGIFAPLPDGQHVCICHEKFIGKNCEDLNYCYHRPCKHCGKCQLTKQWPHYKCECCKKYSGKHCELRNPCEPNPCLNEGECTHDGRTPSCICKPKFKGRFCGEVNNCAPNPCLNGGTCFEKQGEGNFWCECPEAWLGTVCQFPSQCASEPCHNGGSCHEYGGKFQCICVEGFTGKTCSEKICAPNPCFNGGTCVDDGRDFHCICPPWAQGKVCTEISPCLMNPCRNAARCIDRHSGFRWALGPMEYYCLCQPPYYGPHCEVNKCKLCDMHAHCEIDHCECDEGYEGDGTVCRKLPSPCHPNPCSNNGVCIDEGHGFFHCRCKNHYKPPYCIEVNPCNPNPCNGGACIPQGIGGFKCVNCPEGFTGKRCQIIDPCETNPCQHHGACIRKSDSDTSFGCKCINHWSGKVCEVCDCPKSRDPNLPHSFCNEYGLCTCPDNHDWNSAAGICERSNKGAASICDKSNPCECGGTCIPDLVSPATKFQCQCPAQCTGERCEITKYCSNHKPCMNGGTCIDVNDYRRYTCKCQKGFSGQNCTVFFTTTPDPSIFHGPCDSNPCQHNGICVPVGNSYDCKCVTQYMGSHCEVDKCKDCDEHARCLAGECVCLRGYIGNGFVCVKDCKRKCKDVEVCVEGVCQCMPGYNLVRNVCVHIPVEVEEEGDTDDESDNYDGTGKTKQSKNPSRVKPTKSPTHTRVPNPTKNPGKNPTINPTTKPRVTHKSEYEKPKKVTLSPKVTSIPETTKDPITPTAIVPIKPITSKPVTDAQGNIKTTVAPSPLKGVDITFESVGPPGEDNSTKTKESQGPPGSRHDILKGGEEITEIIERSGNVHEIQHDDEDDDDETASEAEEELRNEEEKELRKQNRARHPTASELFRSTVNFEKNTKKIEQHKQQNNVMPKAKEQAHVIKTNNSPNESVSKTAADGASIVKAPIPPSSLSPPKKPAKASPNGINGTKASVKTWPSLAETKNSGETMTKKNNTSQEIFHPPYTATERILKHIQKLEKTFSKDLASDSSPDILNKNNNNNKNTTSKITIRSSAKNTTSHIIDENDVDNKPSESENLLRKTIKSNELLKSSPAAISPKEDSKSPDESPEGWYEASKKIATSKNTQPSNEENSLSSPIDEDTKERRRKTLEKPSISVLTSTVEKLKKQSDDVFSMTDDSQNMLDDAKIKRFKSDNNEDFEDTTTSDSKEDFVELLKQYGKLKDEVTELAFTKNNGKNNFIQEHNSNKKNLKNV